MLSIPHPRRGMVNSKSHQLGNRSSDFVDLLVIYKQSDHSFLMECTLMCRVIRIDVVLKAKELKGSTGVYGSEWRVIRGYPIALKARVNLSPKYVEHGLYWL
jgi:hypothetical protein